MSRTHKTAREKLVDLHEFQTEVSARENRIESVLEEQVTLTKGVHRIHLLFIVFLSFYFAVSISALFALFYLVVKG